jgi:hypothetical protein
MRRIQIQVDARVPGHSLDPLPPQKLVESARTRVGA